MHFGHGFPAAWEEALYLTLHALKLQHGQRHPAPGRTVSESRKKLVLNLIDERIRRRIPAAYITHEAWLAGYRFFVDERVIIPRSLIAGMVLEQLAPWITRPSGVRRILDLCTGSGCLAILLAKAFPRARVDAVDISADALAVAQRNIACYRLQRRVRAIESNLFHALRNERYDLIVSNPPYVSAATMRRLPPEYRKEPRLALAGGKDGLDLVRTIVSNAASHLTDNGLLVVEVGHHRRRVERAFSHLALTWPATSAGDDCVFLLDRNGLCDARRKRR